MSMLRSVLRQRRALLWCSPRRYLSDKKSGGIEGVPNATTMAVLRQLQTYIWPKDDAQVRKRVGLSFGLLVGSKAVNVMVPFILKYAIDGLSGLEGTGASAAVPVALIVAYGVARGTAVLTSELRNAVFAKVAQKAIMEVSVKTFRHVQNLDLSFHLGRSTGALARAIDRGQRGIDWVLRSMVFNVLPTFAEVIMVVGALSFKCGPAFASVAAGTVALYVGFTFATTSWRTKFRKDMNREENAAGNKSIDTLLNYETVKYFNNEDYETAQYKSFLERYGEAYYKTQTSLSMLNFGQSMIFSVALTAMMIMATSGVASGTFTIGDVIMVNGLLFNLSVPLGFLGSVYREVRQSLVDMETLFGLLSMQSGMKIDLKAPQFYLTPPQGSADVGEVEFRNVKFGYTSAKLILDDVSFRVPAGKSAAIVGPSGCGKSTIIRLLFRFYDPAAGDILIDGQNIRNVDIVSLRKALGVIPQDMILFNETVKYNIRYGRVDASDEEVYEAARQAAIHDSIMNFPHAYDTQVGERGLKLSGGEKQRIAIARTMLKDPKILLCDEATSALDSATETDILKSVKKVGTGRTVIFIAHRLSTVADSSQIIVLKSGKVVEIGSHMDLISKDVPGPYATMWSLQQDSNIFNDNKQQAQA